MATILEYAYLADASYSPDPRRMIQSPESPLSGWHCLSFQPHGSGPYSAFQAAAFRKGGEVVFAFKGTDPSAVGDLVADLKLGFGMNTHQFSLGLDFVARNLPLGGGQVSLCGHSLGGAIAQVVGNRLRLPFITFNAPGVAYFSRNLDEMLETQITHTAYLRAALAPVSFLRHPVQAIHDIGASFYWVKGANFRIGGDAIGSIGVHYGKVIDIGDTIGKGGPFGTHGMEVVIPSVRGSSYEDRSLEAVV